MRIFKWFWRHKIISILILVGISVGYWWFFIKNGNGQLETATVERGDVVAELVLSGEIVADEHAILRYPASGKIAYVGVEEGDEVYRGQVLGKMDTTVLNSAFERAKADLRAADANADAVLDSVKDNDNDETFAEKNTRTAAEVAKDKAYEAYITAEYNLRNSSLIAPFEGIITSVAYKFSGVNFIATEPIFEVLNPETMYFSVSADQTEVDDIKIGDNVRIFLDATDNQEILGEVTYVSFAPVAGELGSVYSIKVAFVNPEDNLKYRVGMTGDAYFELERAEDVLFVPPTFIQSDDNRDYILTDDGKNEVDVQTGVEGEDRIEIKTIDISEGTTIYD